MKQNHQLMPRIDSLNNFDGKLEFSGTPCKIYIMCHSG